MKRKIKSGESKSSFSFRMSRGQTEYYEHPSNGIHCIYPPVFSYFIYDYNEMSRVNNIKMNENTRQQTAYIAMCQHPTHKLTGYYWVCFT